MTKAQLIFATVVGATTLATGSWLITVDPAGFGLIVTGMLVLAGNGYASLHRRLVFEPDHLRDKNTSSALS